MPDLPKIKMVCRGVGCPIKEHCGRYKKIIRSTDCYFSGSPFVKGKGCPYFLGDKSVSLFDKLNHDINLESDDEKDGGGE